jgi:hypothetical protein
MRVLILIPFILASAAGCDAASKITPAATGATEVAAKANMTANDFEIQMRKAEPGDAMSPFNKDRSTKPDFPDQRVVQLNAIVKLSYDAIERYDNERAAITETVALAKGKPENSPAMQKAKTAIAEVKKLHVISQDAKQKLTAEGVKLLNGGKYYNIEVFSGMSIFVDKVEKEFGEEVKILNDKIAT